MKNTQNEFKLNLLEALANYFFHELEDNHSSARQDSIQEITKENFLDQISTFRMETVISAELKKASRYQTVNQENEAALKKDRKSGFKFRRLEYN